MIDRRSVVAGAALVAGAAQRAAAQRIENKPYAGPPPTLVELAPTSGILRAQIAPDAGGELSGLQCKVSGEYRELLYRGRNYQPVKGWTGKAPILWPAVGRNAIAMPGGKVGDGPPGWFWKGQHYPMTGHGFARDQKWRLEKSFSGAKTAFAVVSMTDTAATRVMYPFGYSMTVEYRVAGSSVILSFRISAAKANADPMPFSIGNHMTYNLPFVPAGKADRVTIASSAKRNVVLGPGNTPTGQVVDVDFSQPRPLSSLGVQHAYSLSGCRPGETWVRLEDPAGMAITVSHQSDWRPDGEPVLFNLWGDVGQGFFAPEPWVGKQESLASGDGLIHLPPGEDFNWRIAVDVSLFGPLAKA
jgi:galactose mutarotase-like enzyme